MKVVDCKNCGTRFEKSNNRYNEAVKNGWNLFCSLKCRYSFQEKGKNYSCAGCKKPIVKTPAELRKVKFNVFCSKTCSAQFNNRHKQTGTRRSKLEAHIEEQILSYFPNLMILCNSKKTLGYELDFYFPQLKLAIEFNGIYHFQPIFGLPKLKRIQEIDYNKAAKCNYLGIKLFIIDVSRDVSCSKMLKDTRWLEVKSIIESFLTETDSQMVKS